MIFTTSLLLLISLSSLTISSVPLEELKSKTPYLCFNVISSNDGDTEFQNRIQLPDRYITTWSEATVRGVNMLVKTPKVVLVHGSNTSMVVKSKSAFKWPPFILFGNETFKFEYPECQDNEIETNCKSWKYKVREFEPTNYTFVIVKNGIRLNLSYQCSPLSEKDYDQRKEDNKFGEMSENDKLKLCQHYESPGYCPKLTEAQLEEQTPREQPIEAVTSATEITEAVTSATETPKKGHCPNQSVKKR